MKKAVNVTAVSALAIALAASVTYNVVQYRQAKGSSPEGQNQESDQPQTVPGSAAEAPAADPAIRLVSAPPLKAPPANASTAAQKTDITFKSADFSRYSNILNVHFSTPSILQLPDSDDAIEFTPALENASISLSSSGISISGDFIHGATYRVRVKKGITDRSGKATLKDDVVFDLTVPELTEDITFLTSGSLFPITTQKVEFPYSARNLNTFKVKLYRAFDNNLNLSQGLYSTYSMELVGEKTVILSDPRNKKINHMLDISDLLPAADAGKTSGSRFRPGYYVMETEYSRTSEWGYSYRENETQRFMLTDFAMVAAAVSDTAGGMAVFVRRISDGKPVADAEIELSTSKNQLIQRGKTDSTGKATFNIPDNSLTYDKKGYIYSATIRKDDEFAWFSLDLNAGRADDCNKAFVFTERGIVRPGESFLAAAFIRREETAADGGEATGTKLPRPLNEKTPCTVSVISPEGKQIFSQAVTLDEAGFFSQMIKIPDTAVSGYYRVKVKQNASSDRSWGETHIRVGAYEPDRIRTKVEHEPLSGGLIGETAINETIRATLSADYYFGVPVPSASADLNLFCSSDGWRPDHWKDWTVGDSSCFSFDSFRTSGKIENGKATFSLPSFSSRGMSFDPIRVSLHGSVQEPGGRSVSGSNSFTIFPTDWFIGLKGKESAGRECTLDVALLSPSKDGKAEPADGREISFRVYRRDWDYVLVQEYSGFRRRWQETVNEVQGAAKTITVPPDADRAQVTFDLPSGCYDIVAEYGETIRTKINVWHSAGESGRRSGDPSDLVFKTDANTYTPGQTAKLTFVSPTDGEAFLAMGGNRLDSAVSIPVKAGENTIEAKIPADCLNGRYHVKAVVIGKSADEYIRASGDASLELDHSAAHKLNVGIDLPEIVRPETETDVTVSLATLDGKPVNGQACLFAVDEGVLALTGFSTPDIFRFFCKSDDTFISISETYSDLFPKLKIRSDGTIGGGDDAAALAASIVKMKEAVRLVVPAVPIPDTGSATVKVKIPDHSGALRFMAVASSPDAVGSEGREIIVRSPVGLTVSAPHVLAPGDEALITVRAFNHDAKDGAVKFTVDLPDTLQLVGDAPTVSELKTGANKDVSFRVKALDKFGEGKVSATLSVGDESRTEWVYLTVRPATPPQTVTAFATVAPGKDFTIDLSGEFLSVNSSDLVVSSSPAIGVKDALGWLNDYPYGCLEQTVSGAFPFIATQPLVKAGLLDAEVAKTMQPKVPAAYARILNMMVGDGAFAMWPDSRMEWPEGTVYAAHFIFEAKAAGLVTVDESVRSSITAYLLRLANTPGKYTPELRAYAAYVLASAGNRDFVVPARNILAKSKPGFAQFLAAAALVRGGYAGEGAAYLKKSLAEPAWLYGKAPAAGMNDPASRAGMVLNILMKCDPNGSKDDAAKLAASLAGRIRKDGNVWGTTQSNAWACMGLAAFAEYYPPAEISGSVAEPGKEKAAVSGKVFGQSGLDPKGKTVIANSGNADFFVQAVVKGIPKKAGTSSGPITLKRDFYDENGKPVTSLKHGELAFVRVTVETPDVVENLVVSDILPAGLEIEDDDLATRYDASKRIPKSIRLDNHYFFDRTEKRDDRFLAFGTVYKSAYAIYTVRAVIPGKYTIPALHAEAMYDPDMNGTFIPPAGKDVFEVK